MIYFPMYAIIELNSSQAYLISGFLFLTEAIWLFQIIQGRSLVIFSGLNIGLNGFILDVNKSPNKYWLGVQNRALF